MADTNSVLLNLLLKGCAAPQEQPRESQRGAGKGGKGNGRYREASPDSVRVLERRMKDRDHQISQLKNDNREKHQKIKVLTPPLCGAFGWESKQDKSPQASNNESAFWGVLGKVTGMLGWGVTPQLGSKGPAGAPQKLQEILTSDRLPAGIHSPTGAGPEPSCPPPEAMFVDAGSAINTTT